MESLADTKGRAEQLSPEQQYRISSINNDDDIDGEDEIFN